MCNFQKPFILEKKISNNIIFKSKFIIILVFKYTRCFMYKIVYAVLNLYWSYNRTINTENYFQFICDYLIK